MKKLILKPALFSLLFAVTVLSACKEKYGPVISENRSTADFSGVKLDGSSNVTIEYDSVTSVRVETNEDIIDNLKTEVSGNILTIRFNKNLRGTHNTHVYLRTPNLHHVELDGSGDIVVKDSFSANQMNVELEGSGDISFPLNANRVNVDLDGSGNIHLSGDAGQYHANIEGSGDIHSFHLNADTAYATVEGSGNIDLFVLRHLDAYINGSGDINYRGNPATVKSRVSGSGNIRKAD